MPRYPLRRFVVLIGIVVCSVTGTLAHAETAEMLPAGLFNLRYQYTVGHADDAYDADGERRSIAELYRAGLEAEGLSTAMPSFYHIDTDGRVDFARHDLYLQYGVTDSVNLGLWTYYLDQREGYSARLAREAGWSLLPAAYQHAIGTAVGAADAADAAAAAIGDTVLGYKQLLFSESDAERGSARRFAFFVGVRLPTGHVADPTRSGDASTGDGQTDVGLWFSFDWEPSPRWLFNLHTRHEYQLAGERDVLDPGDPGRTLSQEFQPGFYHYVEVKGRYRIARPGFNTELELTAIYEREGEERIQHYDPATGSYRGDRRAVSGSDSRFLVLEPQVGIDLFPRELPLAAKLYAGIPVEGRNAAALEYVGIRFDVFW